MISRFYFNISIQENLKNILNILFFKKNNFDVELKNKMSKIYSNSNFYFFDYGRTAFFEILSNIRKKTKKRKIIINSLTLFEVINIIIYSGFEPVFVDNKKNTFQTDIDLNSFKSDLNEIAGIVITHLNGINNNIVQLKKQIETHNISGEKIYLIEDCAVAMGARMDGQRAGTFGDFSFLSFNIMKNITSYTGGILLDNQKMIEVDNFNYRKLSKIDILKKAIFVFFIQLLNTKLIFPLFFKFVKFSHKHSFNFFLKKYRTDFEVKIEDKFPSRFSFFMHSFQKEILLNQFENLKEKQLMRTQKSEIYFKELKEIKHLNFPQDKFDEQNIFLEFPIVCSTKNIKKDLFKYLMDKKVDVKNYYYKNCSEEKIYNSHSHPCTNSEDISENILMLPVHEKIFQNYQYKIINEIKIFFESYYQ